MEFHKLTIQQVTKVTPQAVEIRFDIPQELVSDFNYQSGQYLTLKATIDGKEVRRAYSLSSAPHENHWSVVVKAVENGVFSNYAMTLRAGDQLDVAAPEGLFVHEKSTNAQTYLGVAAGSGITPIISIIKTVLETEPDSKFALIYGNQSISQTIYFEQINDLQDQYGDRFIVRYSFSREERDGELFGRVTKGNLNFFLKQDCTDYAFAKAYLCGPEDMISMTTDNLVEKEIIAKENIHFELFSTKENKIEITEDSHLTEVTVILDDEEHTFTMKRSDNMLDVMLKNDIDAPYSCQGGICSSCICQIEEGSAQMAKNAILTDTEIAEGLSLACQAYPTSAKVKVNFDEV
ncbi:ferredoxin--NADP reductase [Nonlabens ulvanivorans]|uniref:Flavodoxin reductase n=1 Tax=Nonlabens ulvanivorans TaxID=906888 RepID=A0A084JU92_NONUL|nr:ferredoxin--NADP reductase [Nonlabens ulvanivorans]KEZ92526.1 flavodoxin reductase [Nonlabens ulvanivorans]PRX15364.1 ring-1,2-phenylacetyl-CoA epoxidase subunit PaaE [Nonlabens ulvanivorans]